MNETDCKIYDLIEYKLKAYVDSFHQGTEEWNTAMHVLLLYLDGAIDIKWSEKGMVIIHPSDTMAKEHMEYEIEQRKVLLDKSGSIGE